MEETEHHRASTRCIAGRVAAAAFTVAGLSGSVLAANPAGAAAKSTKSIVISTTHNAKYGTVLVSGNTLYTLNKTGISACTGECLKFWPPVLLPKGATKPTAGSGVSASKLGTVKRAAGELQVTYGGKPVYWYYDDKGPGQVHGDVTDTWGIWSAVVTKKLAASSSGSGATSSSGSGSSTSSGGNTGTGGVAF